MNVIESVDLHYHEGSSDKVYKLEIVPSPNKDGFLVNTTYGRRGSTLQTGTKTKKPLPLGTAQDGPKTKPDTAYKVYNATLHKQLGKGYKPVCSGSIISVTVAKRVRTNVLPQLLNMIDRDYALNVLVYHSDYWAQPKHDGKRLTVRKVLGSNAEGINKKGFVCGAPQKILQSYDDVQSVIDGESVGEIHFAFDCLDYPNAPYSERLDRLENVIAPKLGPAVKVVETAKTTAEKLALFHRLEKEGAEGIVFKRHDAPHAAGRPNSGGPQLKFKFYDTATCLVSEVNNKRSVKIQVVDNDKNLVDIGNVTIPANKEIPASGALVEVKYLYAYPNGGSLYQPVYLGERDDADIDDVDSLESLKFKQDNNNG